VTGVSLNQILDKLVTWSDGLVTVQRQCAALSEVRAIYKSDAAKCMADILLVQCYKAGTRHFKHL
jgi:hypothetical protein